MAELINQTQVRRRAVSLRRATRVAATRRLTRATRCERTRTHVSFRTLLARRPQYAFGAKEPSSTLHLIEFTPTPLGDLDVFVDVTHCGMCHSDLHKVLDEWHDACRYPMVPGHEVVGVVSKIGTRGERWGSERALLQGHVKGRETARARAVGGLGARPPPAALPLC